ncbi:MAG: FkbM family methyltransferase [Acetobacteraceae bacterium]|nr:FkbM family methyltransferase [Acetobacteraceae bacterium]
MIAQKQEWAQSISTELTSISQSRSIRMSRKIRELAFRGADALSRPERLVTGDADRDFRQLMTILGSVWWDLAAPMRLAARLLRKRWRKAGVTPSSRESAASSWSGKKRPILMRRESEREKRLIYDVGMHNGSDTQFYLRKGFDVIAIEANPEHVSRARQKFETEIRTGQLVIYDVALTAAPGEIAFFVHEHDDWSRLNRSFDDRFTEGSYREIKVSGLPFSTIVGQNRTPYYVKVDIEGPELMVIEQMISVGKLPSYVSFEVNPDVDRILDALLEHGYREFHLLAQRDKSKIKLPNPPREGQFYEPGFDGYMSGPFGRELPGAWRSVADVRSEMEAHYRKAREGGDENAYNEWFDIHARHRDAHGTGYFRRILREARRR